MHYERPARFAGETKYPLRKMLRFAIDGITSFSIIPLRFATWLGVLSGLRRDRARRVGAVRQAVRAACRAGWTTLMILVALGSSAQLLMMGILGEYVGRIYEEVKRRPLYAISEQFNFGEPAKSGRVSPPQRPGRKNDMSEPLTKKGADDAPLGEEGPAAPAWPAQAVENPPPPASALTSTPAAAPDGLQEDPASRRRRRYTRAPIRWRRWRRWRARTRARSRRCPG